MIEVTNLKKTYLVAKRQSGIIAALKSLIFRDYEVVTAINNLSFNIAQGELVGYIGPNGAGKSTTIKILSGILVPDSGTCKVGGLIPWKKRRSHVQRLGVVFGQRTQLWWDLPVIESFDLLRDIYSVAKQEYKRNKNRLIELLDLSAILDTPVRQLSLGQRMRCDLAASLIHSPEILFLDEPTIGLDAVAKLAIRDFIKKLNQEQNTTIILTTHDMDDIEALCQRIMIIGNGEILFDGNLPSLQQKYLPEKHLIIDLKNEQDHIDLADTRVISKNGHRVRLAYSLSQTNTKTIITNIVNHFDIADIYVENPPIEEVIARLYQDHIL